MTLTNDGMDSRVTASPIAAMQPLLPTADQLLRYLNRIDTARWYSNHGPLAAELEERLTSHFGGHHRVVVASSGTMSLIAATLARAGRATPGRRRAILPDFTFAATAHAVEACGYEPLVFPSKSDTWLLSPEDVLQFDGLDDVGLIVPVGALGRPVPQAQWANVERITGIPVVIDGAACFEAIERDPSTFLGDIPVALSFHATKTFTTGEGGAVLCRSSQLGGDIESALNFGFRDSRRSKMAASNGKMSEYHAAVGLACLDTWPGTKRLLDEQVRLYAQVVDDVVPGSTFHIGGPQASCYAQFELDDHVECVVLANHLASQQIETRSWYGLGISRHPYFSGADRHPNLGNTPALLGVPMSIDLSIDDMSQVAKAIGNLSAAREAGSSGALPRIA